MQSSEGYLETKTFAEENEHNNRFLFKKLFTSKRDVT